MILQKIKKICFSEKQRSSTRASFRAKFVSDVRRNETHPTNFNVEFQYKLF